MKAIDFLQRDAWRDDDEGPRYIQLRNRIQEGIDRGLLAHGSPLPPEREIAATTGLSRVTVRKAIQELVDAGAVIQRHGSGSFVTRRPPRVEQSLSALTSFSEDMAQRGLETSVVWLERGLFRPSPEEIAALSLPDGESVSRIARLREAGHRPMAIERASLPPQFLPNPTLVTGSLYEVLDRSGNRPVRAVQKISAMNLGEADAALLGVPSGAAGLRIERTSYLPDGRAVEFTQSIYRGDAYDFVAELSLTPVQDHP